MKRYDVWDLGHIIGGEKGNEWVKAEDAEALEQLNKEMLDCLKRLIEWDNIDPHSPQAMTAPEEYTAIINNAKQIITKAEEA